MGQMFVAILDGVYSKEAIGKF